MDKQCEHATLTRQTNDAQYELMKSYKEGWRAYKCDTCPVIFWVKPLVSEVKTGGVR